jgi:release factor glutamine methyltransferase
VPGAGTAPPSVVVAQLRAAGCVFAEDEARLLAAEARTPAELDAMVERRCGGVPLEHVLGWAEFCGHRVVVEPGVFVPRPRTGLLVDEAVALARPLVDSGGRPVVVVDLCCGSGALGVAVAARSGAVELHAADVDPAAVRCARRNVAAFGGQVHHGDLFDALPRSLRGRLAVVLANTPYVPTAAIALLPPEAREHEPRVALDGGVDGLDVARRVVAAAPAWLAPGGHVLIETSDDQAPALVAAAAGHGLRARVTHDDELGATVVVATRPADGPP